MSDKKEEVKQEPKREIIEKSFKDINKLRPTQSQSTSNQSSNNNSDNTVKK